MGHGSGRLGADPARGEHARPGQLPETGDLPADRLVQGKGGLSAVSAMAGTYRAVTASAGNHGLGVAWASARLGRHATVVVPEQSSPPKVAALRSFPIELIEHGADYEEAEGYALELGAEEGSAFISPYNDPCVIAGQSTIGRELDTQVTPGS